MKVAIMINTSWNIYNFRRGLIKAILDRGDEVVAIAPSDDYSHRLLELGCTFRELEMSASGMNPVTDFGLILKMRSILKEERPDVLLTYTIKPNIYGSLASSGLKIPCVCNVSGLGTVFLWTGTVKKVAVALYKRAFKRNSWVFFQNDEDREEFLKLIPISRDKTSLLPGSGIDTNHFQPIKSSGNSSPIFTMIGRLIVEKGIYDFIEAARIVKKKKPEVKFRLIGELDESHSRSIEKSELESWIAEDLIEYVPHLTDVRDAIATSDAVVLPSYREGTPRTLLEAGAMAKAMIATDVPGCRHVVIDGQNGFLCKLKSPKDLAAKMLLFLALSKEERAQMELTSRKLIVEKFDERIVVDHYLKLIDQLLNY
ncbi:glycosyltransferase family 4 protein [Marinoscillum sp.]|uniref:glycosyltransferase family 4 protein n=1 Tax=Marinoscillum sp. TaxID=2024838 RepID=UPI003BABC971